VVGPPPGAGPSFCLVDEADSILVHTPTLSSLSPGSAPLWLTPLTPLPPLQVDEARTPLIIAKQVAAPAERYELAQQMGRVLHKGEHYDVDIKGNTVGILH